MSSQTSRRKLEIEKEGGVPRRVITLAQAYNTYLYAPIYLAQELGYFRDVGLEVEIVTTEGDDTAFEMLISNKAEFAVGDPAFVALSAEREKQGQVLQPILNGAPFFGVTRDPRIPFRVEAKDLKGLRVATFPAPSTAFMLQKRMFQKAGLAATIVEVPFVTGTQCLESGEADIALLLEPEVSLALEHGYRVVYSLGALYPDFVITALTARSEYLEHNTLIVEGVMSAITKAVTYVYEHNPVKIAELLHERFPDVPLRIGEKVIHNAILGKMFVREHTISKAGWSSLINLRLDTDVVANIDLYKRFAERAFIVGINAKDVQKQFLSGGVTFSVLNDISVHTQAGEVLAILGKSGQGKSTFLNLVSGLEQLTAGKILVRGSIGYVFQEPTFLPWRTVLQNILLPLEIKNTLTKKAVEKALSELKRVGLAVFADHLPDQLSGGMKQKASFVRTMLQDPDIILLDEPFSAIDYVERVSLLKDLKKMVIAEKKIALFVTHNIEEAIAVSDKLVVFSERPAKIIYQTNISIPDEYRDPVNVRKSKDFQELFDMIWKLMSKQV